MANEACPLPRDASEEEAAVIRRMLGGRRIAVVGLSDDPDRPSHFVSQYLADHGHEIVPVNPSHERLLGRRSLRSLGELDGPVDVVLVFRRAEYCADIAREAIGAGARGIWLQSGIRNEDARRMAEAAGIDFMQDRCMMVEHRRRGD